MKRLKNPGSSRRALASHLRRVYRLVPVQWAVLCTSLGEAVLGKGPVLFAASQHALVAQAAAQCIAAGLAHLPPPHTTQQSGRSCESVIWILLLEAELARPVLEADAGALRVELTRF